MFKIVGIDPGINSSGKCILTLDDKTFDIVDVQLYGYNKTIKRCLSGQNCQIFHTSTQFTKMNMFDRQNMAYDILAKDMEDVKHVAFEGYAFGYADKEKSSGSLIQIGEFIGGMKKFFYDMGKGIIIYPPRTVKKFAVGLGNAGKTMMCEMFAAEYPEWYPQEVFNKLPQFIDPHADICDAFWIAHTLRHHLIYEILGTDSLDEGTVALLEAKADKDSDAIVDTKLIRKNEIITH